MTTLQIPTARVFRPLLAPARYKGAHGGRGSGKSHFFAELLIEECMEQPGTRAVCIREVQRSIKESSKRLLEDKIAKFGLGRYFDVQEAQIRTPGDGLIIFTGMQSHTAESIKSLEGYRIASADESQSLSQRSMDVLRPTMRGDAELWFSWNPQSPEDPIDALLRGPNPPPRSIVVEANWNDNPWFPDDLREEMEFDRSTDPDKFAWIWGGGYEPRSGPGRYFKEEWLLPVDQLPPRDSLRVYGGSDYAVTDDGGDYTVHVVIGLDPEGNPWVLDVWRDQASSDKWVSAFCDLVIKHRPMAWAEETGQIKSGVGPFLTREMRERRAYCAREQFPTRGDKAVRAQSFRGLVAIRGLRIPAKAPWRAGFENELLRFPAGVHDDQVDACLVEGTMIRMADGTERPIERVSVGDLVTTPIGPCEVTASGITNHSAHVFRVKTEGGQELIATGNHPVFVEGKGFIPVDTLGMMDQIRMEPSCYVDRQRPRASSIGAIAIAVIRTALTKPFGTTFTRPSLAVGFCTGIFGRMKEVLSRRDSKSTIETRIRRTTRSTTSNVFQFSNIADSIRCAARRSIDSLSTLIGSALKPPDGTVPQMASLGIGRTGRRHGRAERPYARFALRADESLKPISLTPDFARRAASNAAMAEGVRDADGLSPLASLSSANVAAVPSSRNGRTSLFTARRRAGCVIAIEELSVPAKVRNLTVSRAHVFYANGFLTHNCGLVGQLLDMMAAGPKPPAPEKKRLEDYTSRNFGDMSEIDPLLI